MKSNKSYSKIIILILFVTVIFSGSVFSQVPPPPPPPVDEHFGSPIDGPLWALLTAGAGYGVNLFLQIKNKFFGNKEA